MNEKYCPFLTKARNPGKEFLCEPERGGELYEKITRLPRGDY